MLFRQRPPWLVYTVLDNPTPINGFTAQVGFKLTYFSWVAMNIIIIIRSAYVEMFN